ncbi:MAG: hypothetical protein ACJ72N_06620 [Labedaea sp.]
MPTARDADSLCTAIQLARQLGCTLVALCSRSSLHSAVAGRAAAAGVELIAIDLNNPPAGLMPRFETTELVAGRPFEQKTDTSLKRNVGLLLACLIGWKRIVFLDDDIAVPRPGDLERTVGLLDSYHAVGMSNIGYPDNSVVCHAYRESGGPQDTFIGGGGLAVGRPAMRSSFFPNIYNEDWFFLLGNAQLRPTAVAGRVEQRPYDPFVNKRARAQELGDCLGEGVFWLLDDGRTVEHATVQYWQGFLGKRIRFITETIERVALLDDRAPAERDRIISALKAARGRSRLITPELCVEYLAAWRTDRVRWQRHVADLSGRLVDGYPVPRRPGRERFSDPGKLLAELGLADRTIIGGLGVEAGPAA